jgi:hypothetical protein
MITLIGLNPSNADESRNDPTITREIGFAKLWGYGGLWMLNAFAFISTDPKRLKEMPDPVGPENDKFILETYCKTQKTVVVWGIHGAYLNRDEQILRMLKEVYCLGLTKDGHPRHPLRLAKNTRLMRFTKGY